MGNNHLKETILGVLENQLKENNPPITKTTLKRLMKMGYTEQQAKEKIAAVLLTDIYDMLKNHREFNEKKFTKELNALDSKAAISTRTFLIGNMVLTNSTKWFPFIIQDIYIMLHDFTSLKVVSQPEMALLVHFAKAIQWFKHERHFSLPSEMFNRSP